MKTETLTIESKIDHLPLSVLTAEPGSADGGDAGSAPRAVLQVAHGMCEHKERYLPFFEFLTENGFACIIHDHRGHGKSVRSDADLGFMYGGGGAALVEDLHEVTLYAKERWPSLPLLLLGHSMGSLVVRCYLKKYDKELAGLVVMGAPAKNPAVGVGRMLAKMQRTFKGDHYPSPMLNGMAFSGYIKSVADRKTDFDWLSVNEQNVADYIADPYCGFPFTVDGFLALFDVLGGTYSKTPWPGRKTDLPIWFISGSEDPCIGSAENFRFAIGHLKSAGYTDVSGEQIPGMRHEVLNETGKEAIFEKVLEKLNQMLNQ